MKSFSKVTITILIFVLCQFVISLPIPQKPSKALTLQLTEDVTVILTGHNAVNNEPSDVYMTIVELSNIEISENQSPEVNFSEIQFPEIKFSEIQLPEVKVPEIQLPEIQFPSLEPIFEKIREFFETIVKFITEYYIIFIIGLLIIVISFISPWLVIGFLRLLGFGAIGIIKGSWVAIAQSCGALGTCAPILGSVGFGIIGIIKGSLIATCQSIAAIGVGEPNLIEKKMTSAGIT
ncbi:8266_t:CDS:2 [Cetraspora pellucida]|uniref:8266_t:CDS:1 n=1 Tax=Cetraspora pellucida TaxID=1433469 RepID=A0A9N9B9U6_9GLOM|nr:8266_t:CDS:2 [Cetraspora pellucida]